MWVAVVILLACYILLTLNIEKGVLIMIERADISGVLTQIRSAQGQIHQGMNASKADFSPLVSGLQENSTQSIAGVGAASNEIGRASCRERV